ncbi:MAG: MmcQ/YjbR family DNA-binding protein [bacterium]|nr:MmcQ/YjbR family DNA-binding protein [bacterium]
MLTRKDILKYVNKEYGTISEKPWITFPKNEVLRHSKSKKWYGIIMEISANKIGINSKEKIDIINLKNSPEFIDFILSSNEKIYPAYHMNKKHWITIALNGSVEDKKIYKLIDTSFNMTEN